LQRLIKGELKNFPSKNEMERSERAREREEGMQVH